MKVLVMILISWAFMTRLLVYIVYERILLMAYNVASSNCELIKQIKLRYTNCNTLNIPIRNVYSFINKHIIVNSGLRYKVAFIDGSGYVTLMIAIALLYIYPNASMFSDNTYVFGMILIFILINIAVDKEERLNKAVLLISDYLENVLAHRNINKRERSKESLPGIEEEKISGKTIVEKDIIDAKDIKVDKTTSETDTKNDIKDDGKVISKLITSAADNVQAEKIINEVLKEFLI